MESVSAADGGDLQHPWVNATSAEPSGGWAAYHDRAVAVDDGADRDDDDDLDTGVDLGELVPVDEAEVLAELDADERHTVEQLAERVRQQIKDRRIFEIVRDAGFCGRDWDKLVDLLAAYGLAVMQAWMRTGYVFAKVKAIGRPLPHSDAEFAELAQNADLRLELAVETVARGLKNFRDAALADNDAAWSPDGGASLTTYFVGTCVQAFNNEFRRWRRHERRWGPNCSHDPQTLVEDGEQWEQVHRQPRIFADPERATADANHLDQVLDELTAEERSIVLLTDAGYEQTEIGELLGLTARAVEGRLYRLRTQKDIRGRLTGGDSDDERSL